MRRRVNSACANSGQARIGSAQSSPSRVGSARTNEGFSKPFINVGRPSSAPVARHSSFNGTSKKSSLNNENSILSLRIEGKAIRSQSPYSRSQQLNRGPLRVLSSFRHPHQHPSRRKVARKSARRQVPDQHCSPAEHPPLFLDGNKRIFSSKYTTIPYGLQNPECLCISSHEDELRCITWGNERLPYARVTDSETSENERHVFYEDGRYLDSPDSATIPVLHFQESSSCNSYSDEAEEGTPRTPCQQGDFDQTFKTPVFLVSKPSPKRKRVINSEIFPRQSETDSVSNDEASESTITSLGQKIKQMASRNNQTVACPLGTQISAANADQKESNWDDEWTHLLRSNHEILLRGSNSNSMCGPNSNAYENTTMTSSEIRSLSNVNGRIDVSDHMPHDIPKIVINESNENSEISKYFNTAAHSECKLVEIENQITDTVKPTSQTKFGNLLEDIAEEFYTSDSDDTNSVIKTGAKFDQESYEAIKKDLSSKSFQRIPQDLKSTTETNQKIRESNDDSISNEEYLPEVSSTDANKTNANAPASYVNVGNNVPSTNYTAHENKFIFEFLTTQSAATSDQLLSDLAEHNDSSSRQTNENLHASTTANNTQNITAQSPYNIRLMDSISSTLLKQADEANTPLTTVYSTDKYDKTTAQPTVNPPAATTTSDTVNAVDLLKVRPLDMAKPISMMLFPKRKLQQTSSVDVINAIQLIEKEEMKDRNRFTKVLDVGDCLKTVNPTSGVQGTNFQERDIIGEEDDSWKPNTNTTAHHSNTNTTDINILTEKLLIFATDIQKWSDSASSDTRKAIGALDRIYQAQKLLEEICFKEKRKPLPKEIPELHRECEIKFHEKQKELEDRIQKNLDLIRKLLDDKKELTEKCENISREVTQHERRHLDKIKLLEEKHALELQNLREKLSNAEQVRREKWTQQKAKLIKDSSYRSLETKMKEQLNQHREEMNRLKETQWEQQREAEEKWVQKLRDLEQQLREKFEKEKEDVSQKEGLRNKERYDHELRHSEMVWQGRLDALQKQHARTTLEKEEEIQRQILKLKAGHEDELRTVKREMESLKDGYEEKLRATLRDHENELCSLRHSNERAQNEWREQIIKDYDEAKQKAEKELRERLRRQRDKEIEKAIREIQQETTMQLEDTQRAADAKIKNRKERYEAELSELESSERISRSRYLEMKGILAENEEETVYLRARLHTQTLELNDFQQMFQVQN